MEQTPLQKKIQELIKKYEYPGTGELGSMDFELSMQELASWVLKEIALKEGWEGSEIAHANRLGIGLSAGIIEE